MQDQTNNSSVKNYDTSTLTDEELAKKAVLARENHALGAAEESVWQEANFIRWLEVQSCKVNFRGWF